jgi:hypothetical protein
MATDVNGHQLWAYTVDPQAIAAHKRPWSSAAVAISGQPPSVATVQTCGTPLRSDTKAKCPPSGAKLGEEQERILAIRAIGGTRTSPCYVAKKA